jgi:hypothetical protein
VRSVTVGLLQPYGWGLGYEDFSDPASPAAGANYSRTVQGQHWERFLAARCLITTDGNAANRLVSLDFINARGTTYVRNAASVVVTASTTNQAFEWNIGRTIAEWNTNTPVFCPLMSTFLQPAFTVQITLDNIQAGDQISGIHLWMEKWPTGPRGVPEGMVTQYELETEHLAE